MHDTCVPCNARLMIRGSEKHAAAILCKQYRKTCVGGILTLLSSWTRVSAYFETGQRFSNSQAVTAPARSARRMADSALCIPSMQARTLDDKDARLASWLVDEGEGRLSVSFLPSGCWKRTRRQVSEMLYFSWPGSMANFLGSAGLASSVSAEQLIYN